MTELIQYGPRELVITIAIVLTVFAFIYAPTLASFALLAAVIWVFSGTIYAIGLRIFNRIRGVA